jgi:hypothetical protein
MKIDFIPVTKQAKLFPPEPIKKNLPKWYKSIGNIIDGGEMSASFLNKHDIRTSATIKKCVPFMDFMTSGYLLKFHTEILIDPIEEHGLASFAWRHPSEKSPVGVHSHAQCPVQINGKRHQYIKFLSPWVIKTPQNYSCLFIQPMSLDKDFYTLFSGIVDTDTYDDAINFPGYITTTHNFKIEVGDPMMMVFPFKRDNWKMEVRDELFDKEKSQFIIKFGQYFENIYRNFFHSKKRYE